ncbi:MAG TPA: mechanosensitive ion channel family protein [Salegentibacter sp.]|nr:mechanosensitive ion channel family protein [Salegentibacter sp.]
MFDDYNFYDSLKKIGVKLQEWLDAIILNLPNFVLAILVFAMFLILARYLGKVVDRIFRNSIKQVSIRRMIIKVMKVTVVLIGFFVALGLLNLDKVLTTVLASAGVVGLAIGLALQGTLNNTFSGVILSFLPEIQIGDWIETNSYAGQVIDINLRNIVIKQADNNYVVIPNSKIVEEPFKNFSSTPRTRVMLDCGIAYNSNLEFVQQLSLETIEKIFPPKSNEEVEFMYTEFADSSINFVLRFWIDATANRDMLKAKNEAIIAIKKAFDANDINIPFPIRTIDFSNNLSLNKPENDQ